MMSLCNLLNLAKRVKFAFIYRCGVHFPYLKIRRMALRALGYKVGKDIYFSSDLIITMGLLNRGGVILGDRVSIGPRCTLVVASHPNNSKVKDLIRQRQRFIKIENDVWLGAGVIVLPGVTIGEGVVVGAGTVVTKDIPPHCVAVGNPACVIKSLK